MGQISSLLEKFPIIHKILKGQELFWINPNYVSSPQQNGSISKPAGEEGLTNGSLRPEAVYDAEARLKRFAPLIADLFPETRSAEGVIESPLREAPLLKKWLINTFNLPANNTGKVLLKCDNELPISCSIKARGGIYEVLKHAEALLEKQQKELTDYSELAQEEYRNIFAEHTISVGSTGNLGLSIGIMGRALGFNVTVHMSSDAKEWKKQLLRQKNATVIEHQSDYTQAVEEGRKACSQNPLCYFIDDENSKDLFYGYSVAGLRIARQLKERNIPVDKDHPLFVYLPCGVGGGPGGITYGLKLLYGANVHCIFAEPTKAPAMFLGLLTGLHDKISVADFAHVKTAYADVTSPTVADGLAVVRPSGLVGKNLNHLISAVYTVNDPAMLRSLAALYKTENVPVEPSSAAAVPGMWYLLGTEEGQSYIKGSLGTGADTVVGIGISGRLKQASHIIWLTGGKMVPQSIFEAYMKQGEQFLIGSKNPL